MGGLKQGVRASIYISRRIAVGLGSALPRSRLLVKAGSRVLTEVSRQEPCRSPPGQRVGQPPNPSRRKTLTLVHPQ